MSVIEDNRINGLLAELVAMLDFKKNGYENCVNVLGGIDAWAALIDRDIRRY